MPVPLPLLARLVALSLLLVSATFAATPSRPNIVLILLDNLGREWIGAYGSEENCTPQIDRLARTGVLAENCYTPPVCGPSRTVLLTGRYPHSTGFRLHHDAALYSGGGLDPRREVIFPRLFRDAGYATAIVGKWQINHLYDEPDALTRHGFGEQLVWPGSVDADRVDAAGFRRYWDAVRRENIEETVEFIQRIESRYWDPVFLRNGRRETLPGRFGPDVAQEFAFDFLRRHRDRPFLLYYPMVLTHGHTYTVPVVPTPLNRQDGRPHREMYADMLRYADKLVGDLVAELERLGLRDNTLVVVATDNGTEKSFSARRGGRSVQGGLYTLTEAGGNVALLFNAPKLVPGGRTLPLTDFSDLYPTLCDFAGIPLSPAHRPDGVSLAPFLRGAPGAVAPREWILNEYHTTRVVRDRQFKLYNDGRFFDAVNDPDEQHDLARRTEAPLLAARQRLQQVLAGLPADVEPPFLLRSQSGFKIRNDERAKARKN